MHYHGNVNSELVREFLKETQHVFRLLPAVVLNMLRYFIEKVDLKVVLVLQVLEHIHLLLKETIFGVVALDQARKSASRK